MSPRIRIAFMPVYQNPYQRLLTESLKLIGVEVLHFSSMPSIKWLIENRDNVDILHLHWISGLYMTKYFTPFSIIAFTIRLYFANYLKYHIIWTAHNILPHKKPFNAVHIYMRNIVFKNADAVITHCNFGREKLVQVFQPKIPIYVIPHGNYEGVYEITMTKVEARLSLEINKDQFVYLMIGNISEYKGIEKFIKIFQHNASNTDIAVIAGRNRAPDLVSRLKIIAQSDRRIRFFPGYIPEDEMQRYLLSSDVAVFAFNEILTSGTVILCLTYGIPVIAPSLGCLPELITPEAGILYFPDESQSFAQALISIKKSNLKNMSLAAKRITRNLKWEEIAQKTKSVYLDCINS